MARHGQSTRTFFGLESKNLRAYERVIYLGVCAVTLALQLICLIGEALAVIGCLNNSSQLQLSPMNNMSLHRDQMEAEGWQPKEIKSYNALTSRPCKNPSKISLLIQMHRCFIV